MLTTDRERKICERYSARKADGKVSCHSCPLNKGNPNIYDFRCKANSHYDRHKREWVEDARCGNCEHCTFRFNKVWCDIKSEPYPQKVCEYWKMKGEG